MTINPSGPDLYFQWDETEIERLNRDIINVTEKHRLLSGIIITQSVINAIQKRLSMSNGSSRLTDCAEIIRNNYNAYYISAFQIRAIVSYIQTHMNIILDYNQPSEESYIYG